MAKPSISTKRLQIDKANSTVVIAAGVAAFIFVFCAVATKTLVSQAAYQNRIISAKKTAVNQLEADIEATGSLSKSYNKFNSEEKNILGGQSTGVGPLDGTNSKIILDALPSTYDFPALTNSLEKLASGQGVEINSITGTDDQVNQSKNAVSSTPVPAEMPFSMAVTGNYDSIQNMIKAMQNSIRPIQIQTMAISASDASRLTLTLSAKTYYQPAKSLNINTEVIK